MVVFFFPFKKVSIFNILGKKRVKTERKYNYDISPSFVLLAIAFLSILREHIDQKHQKKWA